MGSCVHINTLVRHAIKRNVSRLDRVYRRTKDPVDRTSWIQSIREKHLEFKRRESEYWERVVTANSGNSKKLWQSVSTILGKPSSQHSSKPLFSADDFLQFIEEKVSKVRDATAGSLPPVFRKTVAIFPGLKVCSQVDLQDMIKGSPSKTCDLDPAPTFLVKDHVDVMLQFLTRLCNATILEGGLPQSQRTAIIVPRLKGQVWIQTRSRVTDLSQTCPLCQRSSEESYSVSTLTRTTLSQNFSQVSGNTIRLIQ